MSAPVPLADIFPPATDADWHDAIVRVRRSARANLHDSVAESTASVPLFLRSSSARAVGGRPAGQPWVAVERIGCSGNEAVTAFLAEAVRGGATGAELVFAESMHPLAANFSVGAAGPIAEGMAGLLPEGFHLRVAAPASALTVFLETAAVRRLDLVAAFDPVAAFAARGPSAGPLEEGIATLADAMEVQGIAGAAAVADGRLWNAGGATDEQELGIVLATYVALLRLTGAVGRIDVALAVDADQFRAIAKVRATRLLVARVAEVANISARAPRIHAETAWRMLATQHPEMNVLRSTNGAFGAAIGGADSITVLPHDVLAGGGGEPGRRLARNTSTILAGEANLHRVTDPAAGSGAIEAATAALAEAAWRRFQSIEAGGGIVDAIGGGSLLREIAETREARLMQVATGAVAMVGVNRHAGDAKARVYARRSDQGETLVFRRVSEPLE
jgi:methylmalonyl-CoA mutase